MIEEIEMYVAFLKSIENELQKALGVHASGIKEIKKSTLTALIKILQKEMNNG